MKKNILKATGDVELIFTVVPISEHDHRTDLADFLFGLQRGRFLLNLGFLLQRKILIFHFCVIFGYKKELYASVRKVYSFMTAKIQVQVR